MSRLLKLLDNEDPELSSEDVLSIHVGYLLTRGKVAYSTDIPVSTKPKYVILVLGNVSDFCYLFEVEDYVYNKDTVPSTIIKYSPDKYKKTKKKTWFLFKSVQKIPVDFLDELSQDNTIHDFKNSRANHKIIGED